MDNRAAVGMSISEPGTAYAHSFKNIKMQNHYFFHHCFLPTIFRIKEGKRVFIQCSFQEKIWFCGGYCGVRIYNLLLLFRSLISPHCSSWCHLESSDSVLHLVLFEGFTFLPLIYYLILNLHLRNKLVISTSIHS